MSGSSQEGFQHAFDRFYAACVQAGTKMSAKKIEVLCLLRRPRQCMVQVSGNTLQQVETFKYLGVVFTNVRTKRLIHGLIEKTQFCVIFIALWSQNGSFHRTQSFQFLNWSLFLSSPVVMNLKGGTTRTRSVLVLNRQYQRLQTTRIRTRQNRRVFHRARWKQRCEIRTPP